MQAENLMEWKEKNSILISKKRYGENGILLKVFTPEKGVWSGFFRGNKNNKTNRNINIGDILDVRWKSRLNNNLGIFHIENAKSTVVYFMQNMEKLSLLMTLLEMINSLIHERDIEKNLYDLSIKVLMELKKNHLWRRGYIEFELELLSLLGFRLQLDKCVVSGKSNNLKYISPKSGCAVSEEYGKEYNNKLIKLPPALYHSDNYDYSKNDFYDILAITEYFLCKQLDRGMDRDIPNCRLELRKKYSNNIKGELK